MADESRHLRTREDWRFLGEAIAFVAAAIGFCAGTLDAYVAKSWTVYMYATGAAGNAIAFAIWVAPIVWSSWKKLSAWITKQS
ncbi:hypothetical protein U0C82_08215 [Fulvimarina sp. 2208YS6-2-32]|uniref:Uncharacterized protein n=1 Tax=Fulvimarina uroteuthidis TaxID=3098149 RepID=A0ABU5I2C7_9HYPH|nr:hypothetical protein [Fulvimarina sp. 2208YS6-2-32]MDY8109128.1 hypothetical protein [Fulvimarina sp. 2208YS6-2-32]